jgi:hypothetical protein
MKMRWHIEGEDWIPTSQAKAEYKVNSEQLRQAVANGELRTTTRINPHNDTEFTLYAVEDLEALFGRNRKTRKPNKREVELWRERQMVWEE